MLLSEFMKDILRNLTEIQLDNDAFSLLIWDENMTLSSVIRIEQKSKVIKLICISSFYLLRLSGVFIVEDVFGWFGLGKLDCAWKSCQAMKVMIFLFFGD